MATMIGVEEGPAAATGESAGANWLTAVIQNKGMTAEIVSVGTELLLGQITDTHAPTMARILADCGIGCTRRQTVGDNLDRLVESLNLALSRADIVITIGGLGPTQDDLTREGISAALNDPLILDEGYEKALHDLFNKRGFTWVESNKKQAMRPTSSKLLDNPNGTAPGLLCEKDGKVVIALPGPRNEFNPMAEGVVRDYLERIQGGRVIHSRTLRVCGLGESLVEEKIKHLMEGDNPTVAPYAHPAEVHLRVTAHAGSREEANRMIDPMEMKIREILGSAVYGVDEQTLESAIIDLLNDRNQTIAVAESVTGGWLGQRITSVSGSGDVFLGGVISYAISVKEEILGVAPEMLEVEGPVSEECARQMADGVRTKLNADFGISLTGNAGPRPDVDDKPVGLVFIGLAGPLGTEVRKHQLRGGRDDIRQRATQLALVQLRDALLASV
jgi:nicotinamide-nucleotide amidase